MALAYFLESGLNSAEEFGYTGMDVKEDKVTIMA